MSFEVVLLVEAIASSEYFAWDYHYSTRERGTHERRGLERRNFIPRLRFGLG
jgi:hypothetical protein